MQLPGHLIPLPVSQQDHFPRLGPGSPLLSFPQFPLLISSFLSPSVKRDLAIHRHGRVLNEKILERAPCLCHSLAPSGSEGGGWGDDPGTIGANTLSVTLTLLTGGLCVTQRDCSEFQIYKWSLRDGVLTTSALVRGLLGACRYEQPLVFFLAGRVLNLCRLHGALGVRLFLGSPDQVRQAGKHFSDPLESDELKAAGCTCISYDTVKSQNG
jgi:hypothetical protein